MKPVSETKRRFVVGAFYAVALILWMVFIAKYPNFGWMGIMNAILVAMFGRALSQSIKGELIEWKEYTNRDKIIFVVGWTIFFICFNIPYKEDMSILMVGIGLLIGGTFLWLLIRLFGKNVSW